MNMEQQKNKNANPGENNIVRNWLSGIGVALVVLIAITYIVHRKDSVAPVVASDENTATTTDASATSTAGSTVFASSASTDGTITTAAAGESISVADQPAGDSVAIGSMTLTKKSWVAVKSTDGRILGAGFFAANATSGSVPLLRATAAGERYEVLIYVDDGDHLFNFHKDMLVTSADGSPVSAAFSAK